MDRDDRMRQKNNEEKRKEKQKEKEEQAARLKKKEEESYDRLFMEGGGSSAQGQAKSFHEYEDDFMWSKWERRTLGRGCEGFGIGFPLTDQ